MWSLISLEFLQDPYLETLHLLLFYFSPISTISLMVSLTGSAVDPVKSCIASGEFSPARICCVGLGGFRGFFKAMVASSRL